MAGDLETRPQELLTIATGIAPRFDKAINNLGVCLARSGEPDKALESYRKGLAIDPENAMILTNMTRALPAARAAPGRREELLARIEATNEHQPLLLRLPGRDGAEPRGARQGPRLHGRGPCAWTASSPEVHIGFVKVYLALGDMEKARHHLERALKLDATNQDALPYARLLGQ